MIKSSLPIPRGLRVGGVSGRRKKHSAPAGAGDDHDGVVGWGMAAADLQESDEAQHVNRVGSRARS
jgi:hypothetical protein